MADNGITDDDRMPDWFFQHFRTLAKAALMSMVVFFSIEILSGSFVKAGIVCAFCLAFGLFNTWRRYLEPITFVIFWVAVVYWCDSAFVSHVRLALF